MVRSLNTRWSMLDGLDGRSAEESWRWFIERYRPYIRRCIDRLVTPPDRAARATEEIWSYLFTSSMLERADRGRRFRSYLAGTVRHYALDWLRRDDVVAGEGGAEAPAPAAPAAAALVEERELALWKQQVVQLALQELAARHAQQAKVLRWFYGIPASSEDEAAETRSASWIAGQLGIQANAVHQIVFRGRKRLRSCIENEVRETVRDADDLDDEMRLIYAVIEQENPGLEE